MIYIVYKNDYGYLNYLIRSEIGCIVMYYEEI